ncbi:8-oxoguanine DNA glycosylase OGG fold protein [Kitasatospora griseola]|uniref:8-oxoguanine DNA glycosylase OGG fold protein n=1 Tax=Kitasatospora griseola TaxID=2064 RepID=UPI00382D960C
MGDDLNVASGDFPVPDLAAMLGQAVPFDRSRWMPLLPDATWWPTDLDDCPQAGCWPRVDRRAVFALACRAGTVEANRQLLVAALVWGSGTKAREVKRRGRIFARNSVAELDARLGSALTVLREEGAVAAYRAFNNAHRIPYLGPAFFSKVLYFAGDRDGDGAMAGPHRPLILDRVVSVALRRLRIVDAGWPLRGWTSSQYAQYLGVVHGLAQQRSVRPDRIEAALFHLGGQATRKRRQGAACCSPAIDPASC